MTGLRGDGCDTATMRQSDSQTAGLTEHHNTVTTTGCTALWSDCLTVICVIKLTPCLLSCLQTLVSSILSRVSDVLCLLTCVYSIKPDY